MSGGTPRAAGRAHEEESQRLTARKSPNSIDMSLRRWPTLYFECSVESQYQLIPLIDICGTLVEMP